MRLHHQSSTKIRMKYLSQPIAGLLFKTRQLFSGRVNENSFDQARRDTLTIVVVVLDRKHPILL